jgi:hypothetical protein
MQNAVRIRFAQFRGIRTPTLSNNSKQVTRSSRSADSFRARFSGTGDGCLLGPNQQVNDAAEPALARNTMVSGDGGDDEQ